MKFREVTSLHDYGFIRFADIYSTLQGLTSSQWCWWRFRSSGMLQRVYGKLITVVLKDRKSFLTAKQSNKSGILRLLDAIILRNVGNYCPTKRRNISEGLNVLLLRFPLRCGCKWMSLYYTSRYITTISCAAISLHICHLFGNGC